MCDPTRFKLWIVYFRTYFFTGSCKQFYRGWAWTGQFIQRVGLPEMTWSSHFIELNFLANHFIEDGHVAVVLVHRFCFFRGFTWTGHFIEAFSVGGGGIKWPVQHRFCFFRSFTWSGHFIEAFSVWGGGIKWPVQHRFCFFRGFTWTGHFIEKKISLERGPQGEWGPGRAAAKCWTGHFIPPPPTRARQKGLKIEAILARARAARPGPLSPKGPLSKESVLEAFSVGGGGIKWPVQHRVCFTIDSVNHFDIDICLAVGFVRFRSHSKSFGFPIDEIDDIPPKFERGPSTL